MHAYRTHVVIADPGYTLLKGLPFLKEQCVEVVLLDVLLPFPFDDFSATKV